MRPKGGGSSYILELGNCVASLHFLMELVWYTHEALASRSTLCRHPPLEVVNLHDDNAQSCSNKQLPNNKLTASTRTQH